MSTLQYRFVLLYLQPIINKEWKPFTERTVIW